MYFDRGVFISNIKNKAKAQTNSLHHDLRVRFPLFSFQPTTSFLLSIIVMLPSHFD